MKNKDLFIDDLIKVFPDLKEEMLDDDYSFSITLQMGRLKRYIQKAIDGNNSDIFDSMIVFFVENLSLVDDRVRNAIFISFLGKLDFSTKPEFKQKLIRTLGKASIDLEKYREYKLFNQAVKTLVDFTYYNRGNLGEQKIAYPPSYQYMINGIRWKIRGAYSANSSSATT